MKFNSCDEGFSQNRMRWIDVLLETHGSFENFDDFTWWNKDVADQNEVFIQNMDRMIRNYGFQCPKLPTVKRRARLPLAIYAALVIISFLYMILRHI